MGTRVICLLCLIFAQAYTQLCGPGIFPGALPYECGPYGPILGPLSQPNCLPPPCQPPPCQPPPCQLPPCQPAPCQPIVNIPYNPGPLINPCGQPGPPPCGQPLFNTPSYHQLNIPFNQPSPCSLPSLAIEYLPQANPVVTTTVVDNTLANTLANAIQLLILSNLLESTVPPSKSYGLYESSPCNVIEITPEYYPYNQIVTCEPPIYEILPCIETCQEPIVSFGPCLDVNPCSKIGPFTPIDIFNPYGIPCDSCGLNLGCFDSLVNYGNFGQGCVNTFPNGFNLESIFSPVAAEVVFPSEIPAQMVCNFGYMPTNVPCVSVNVEPLPFDACSCNNIFY